MKKRNLVFVLIATVKTIFGVELAFCQNPIVSVKTIERIKTTVVPIVCTNISKEMHTIGSAFFINEDGFFLTAAHVVKDWGAVKKQYGQCYPSIYVMTGIITGGREDSTSMKINRFGFNKLITSDAIDIAVCVPDTNPFSIEYIKKEINFIKFERPQRIKDGIPIAVTGFPFRASLPITSKGYIASYLAGNETIALDINAAPGNSGSPVYLNNGKVIGVLLKGQRDESGAFPLAQSTEAIIKFLSKERIRFYVDK